MIPELSAFIILLVGICIGLALASWILRIRLYLQNRRFEASEEQRLARSAEIQHKALANGKEFGLYGKYVPDGSRTALEEAQKEADKLRNALEPQP
jgi:hypothetical protein